MSFRVRIFGIEIDPLTIQQATQTVLDWVDHSKAGRGLRGCRFIVTPNVDHTVMLAESPALRAAYEDAHLVLADGWPVVAASRLLGRPLPQRVAGSDLVPHVFAAATEPIKVYLLGAMPDVAQRAKTNIERQWPNVEVVGCYSPPFGFEHDPERVFVYSAAHR